MAATAADLDHDGDLDVAASSRFDDTISWFENTDGGGNFGPRQVISTVADGAMSIAAADLDLDGDFDLLSTTRLGNEVSWYENLDGEGSFSSAQPVTSLAVTPFSATAADADGDGDLDVAFASSTDNTIAWSRNDGGQFSLATTDVAPALVSNAGMHELLKIVVHHEGRAGDTYVELASLELRFTDGAGNPLTPAQLESLIFELRLYLDDGTDTFDGPDIEADSISTASLTDLGDGVFAWTLADDRAALWVALGTPSTYFLVAEMTADAAVQSPHAFDVTHHTESSSGGDDADHDIPLLLEFASNVATSQVETVLNDASCQATLDLTLTDRTVSTTLTCEAGTVLTAGANVVVVTPGALTLRAGQAIELDDGFAVEGGAFTAEIDESLEL